jgi:phenylacetate-coenzyme A ligase PaaK-like adenylate-forming protein
MRSRAVGMLQRAARWLPGHPGRARLAELRALHRLVRMPAARLAEMQWRRLLTIAERAASVPFHAERMRAAGWSGPMPRSADEFARLPPLTADDLRREGTRLLVPGVDARELLRITTSGTTGTPRAVYWRRDEAALREAGNALVDEWAGYRTGCRVAFLWGGPPVEAARPPKASPSRLERWWREATAPHQELWLPVGDLTPAVIAEHHRRLAAFRPDLIVSYPGLLAIVARGLDGAAPPIRPRAVVTSAEPLGEKRRALLERVFACRVFDRYGTRENGVIAGECHRHDGLHVNVAHFRLEIVDAAGRPLAPGQSGRVVVTDLRNTAMPMLRYLLDDLTMLLDEPCACGSSLPRIAPVAGRLSDVVLCPSGRTLGLLMFERPIEAERAVEQYRLRQDTPDEVRVEVVAPALDEARRRALETALTARTGGELRVRVVGVPEIRPTASGKYPAIDSPIARAALASAPE